jgi:hypothetical protein
MPVVERDARRVISAPLFTCLNTEVTRHPEVRRAIRERVLIRSAAIHASVDDVGEGGALLARPIHLFQLVGGFLAIRCAGNRISSVLACISWSIVCPVRMTDSEGNNIGTRVIAVIEALAIPIGVVASIASCAVARALIASVSNKKGVAFRVASSRATPRRVRNL